MRPTERCWTRVARRGLRDPVRALPEAIAEITARLKREFDTPETSLLRRAEIIERIALVRAVLTTHMGFRGGAVREDDVFC
jgi:hypothetical protein